MYANWSNFNTYLKLLGRRRFYFNSCRLNKLNERVLLYLNKLEDELCELKTQDEHYDNAKRGTQEYVNLCKRIGKIDKIIEARMS